MVWEWKIKVLIGWSDEVGNEIEATAAAQTVQVLLQNGTGLHFFAWFETVHSISARLQLCGKSFRNPLLSNC